LKERHKERTIERGNTEAVEAECAIVKEVADVSRLGGHGAEGVGTAGGEGVHADQQHVHQQGPGVAVRQEVQRRAQDAEAPQEVPGRNTGCCCSGAGAEDTGVMDSTVLLHDAVACDCIACTVYSYATNSNTLSKARPWSELRYINLQVIG